ncbi:MAG: CHAT domain-containing protein [Acidobacteria bacterium]|nr:CHAT domain-containing protein [Acidobacteriota bacterium]
MLKIDKQLRMFALVVKGELDGEINSTAMRQDWAEVETLARELGAEKWQYRAEGQLGFADYYDGDLTGAQKKVAEALLGSTNINDIGGQIFYLSTTATGLVAQGMNDQALQYADRAIALANATPDAGYPQIALEARIAAMINKGQTNAAKAELKIALADPAAQNSHSRMLGLNSMAGMIARAEKDLPTAIEYLTEALRHAVLADDRKMIPDFQNTLSDLYRRSGNVAKAEEFANEAAISVQTFGYIPLIPRSLQNLAELQVAQGKYDDAERTYDRAAAIQDIMIGNADSELGKVALVKGASDIYAKHIALIAEHRPDSTKAFAVVEQARGRVLTDLLISGAKTSPESLANEKKIAQLRLKLMSARSNRDVEQLRDAIFLAEQSRSITPQISIVSIGKHKTISLDELQANLSASEVVLEYVLDDPASYCLVITHTQYRITRLSGTQTISAAVTAYLKEVKAKRLAGTESRRLYELLLGPVPEASQKEQLIIVRDGALHLLGFDALIDNHNQYVVQSRTVVYAPSATAFFLLRTPRRHDQQPVGVLAVGGVPYDRSGLMKSGITRGLSGSDLPDLPSSEDEARVAIKALPGPQNTLLIGSRATETAVKRAINHRTIHFAVHGIPNESRPDRAALVLLSDPQNGEDGFLEASEVVQLHLNADLVVLSACDTAVGPLEGEEGIETLSRSFLLAGAQTVVSTLWSIDDDSTLYLMKRFYAVLARTSSPALALRFAKLHMLDTFGLTKALPYYWAGFTVEGLVQSSVRH